MSATESMMSHSRKFRASLSQTPSQVALRTLTKARNDDFDGLYSSYLSSVYEKLGHRLLKPFESVTWPLVWIGLVRDRCHYGFGYGNFSGQKFASGDG